MSTTKHTRKTFESPAGKGQVFNGDRFIAEVDYRLQVFQDESAIDNSLKYIVTGSLKRTDRANILWGSEMLTLHLQDKRKLDFVCVDFNPECEIASSGKFYS